MTYRPKPKYASRDATRGAWVACDSCGFQWSQSSMAFQYDYLGGSVPQNTGFLKCPRCMNALRYQAKLIIIPPDPPPLYNTRPENYVVDETNWLTIEDNSILATENDEDFIQQIPNPADDANTTYLSARLAYPAGSVAVLYLDLFNGDPNDGGTSVLEAITGSATRTNVESSVEAVAAYAESTEDIAITASCLATTNVTHIAFYDAATGGNLLVAGPVGATQPPSIAVNNAVTIRAPDLYFDLS